MALSLTLVAFTEASGAMSFALSDPGSKVGAKSRCKAGVDCLNTIFSYSHVGVVAYRTCRGVDWGVLRGR